MRKGGSLYNDARNENAAGREGKAMTYPAHLRSDAGGNVIVQSVESHCRNCARLAVQESPPGMAQTAYLCGLLHDMGKFTGTFANYLMQAAQGVPVRRGSVNHTFAGARFALERWHTSRTGDIRDLTSEMIAFVAGSHHGQFDGIDESGKNGYQHRLTAPDIGYAEAKAAFLSQCAAETELDTLFMAAVEEVTQAMARFRAIATEPGRDAVPVFDAQPTAFIGRYGWRPAGYGGILRGWGAPLSNKRGALPVAALPADGRGTPSGILR